MTERTIHTVAYSDGCIKRGPHAHDATDHLQPPFMMWMADVQHRVVYLQLGLFFLGLTGCYVLALLNGTVVVYFQMNSLDVRAEAWHPHPCWPSSSGVWANMALIQGS